MRIGRLALPAAIVTLALIACVDAPPAPIAVSPPPPVVQAEAISPALWGFEQYFRCAADADVTSIGDRGSASECLAACKSQPKALGCWYLDGTGGIGRDCRVCRTTRSERNTAANDWAQVVNFDIPVATPVSSGDPPPPPAPPPLPEPNVLPRRGRTVQLELRLLSRRVVQESRMHGSPTRARRHRYERVRPSSPAAAAHPYARCEWCLSRRRELRRSGVDSVRVLRRRGGRGPGDRC